MMATMRDVAELAGVSAATVSRVLNGNPGVDPTRAREVHQAIKKLGYRPNGAARSLRTRRASVLGLLISDIRNAFYTDMVRGVEDVAYANGFSLVLCNSSETPEREQQYLDLAAADNFSGVILAPGRTDPSGLESFLARNVPLVTVNGRLSTDAIDRVVVDNAKGVRLAVEHLLEQGCRRIGFVGGPTGAYTADERLKGYLQALGEARVPVVDRWMRFGDFGVESGGQAMGELLDDGEIDAVVVINNRMTLGASVVLKQRGVPVPDRVALVGFDDVAWAEAMTPTLTTVTQPVYDLGSNSARLLLDRIKGYDGAPREMVFAPKLVVRESSTPQRP